jgi:hypothetical protein
MNKTILAILFFALATLGLAADFQPEDLAGTWSATDPQGTHITYTFNRHGTLVWSMDDPYFSADYPSGAQAAYTVQSGNPVWQIAISDFKTGGLQGMKLLGILQPLTMNQIKLEAGGIQPAGFGHKALVYLRVTKAGSVGGQPAGNAPEATPATAPVPKPSAAGVPDRPTSPALSPLTKAKNSLLGKWTQRWQGGFLKVSDIEFTETEQISDGEHHAVKGYEMEQNMVHVIYPTEEVIPIYCEIVDADTIIFGIGILDVKMCRINPDAPGAGQLSN